MSDAMMGVSAPASTVKPDCLHNVPSRVARVIQDCCAEMRMPVRVVMSHAKDRWACEVRSEAMRRVRAMPTAS